jgi:molybdate transport system substrate-binding protein
MTCRDRHALLGMALMCFALGAPAAEISVAVAANFAGPLARIAEGFTAATGHTLKVSSGPTGKFYSQILSGAPFEVLIAADDETPKKLIAEGHAVAGSQFTYAIGQLVLWSAQPGLVDDQGAVLASGKFTRLAIANPKIAPYGQAALEVLKARGLSDVVTPEAGHRREHRAGLPVRFFGQCRARFVALSQVAVPGKPVIGSLLAGARQPAWRNPPGRGAAEDRTEQGSGDQPARLPEERTGPHDHPVVRLRLLIALSFA